MDRFLDLSKNSIQYGNSMCSSMIRKLKVIVYIREVFLLSKFKYFCFLTILDMSLISRSCKNDHIIFNVGTPSLEARHIRLVNIITYGNKKICVFTVTRSTLIFASDPMNFYTEFG
jgi:hypothetical protein